MYNNTLSSKDNGEGTNIIVLRTRKRLNEIHTIPIIPTRFFIKTILFLLMPLKNACRGEIMNR